MSVLRGEERSVSDEWEEGIEEGEGGSPRRSVNVVAITNALAALAAKNHVTISARIFLLR